MTQNVADDVAGGELLGSAVDTLPSNIAVLNDEGTILATNRSWREFARANDLQMSSNAVGVNYLEITDAAADADAARASDGIHAVLRGDREQFELEYPCHSPDEKRWFLLRATSFSHEGDRYAAVEHVDITERVEREQALHDAYEISASDRPFPRQVDALLDTARDLLGTEFGILSRVRGEEYTFESVAAPPVADLQAGDTAPLATLPKCERVVERVEPLVVRDVAADAPELLDSEWGIAAYLGAPVVVNGEVYGTFCFYSTEAQADEFTDWEVTFVELLGTWVGNELERRYYTNLLNALDTAFPDLGFLIDADGTYLDYLASPETTDRLVARADELPGQTLHDVLPADTADTILATVREAIATDRLQTVEYELDVPAGTRWFEARIAPSARGGYSTDTAVVIARDVTERKEREARLRETTTMLRSVQQTMASSKPFDEKMKGLLEFGRAYLSVEQAFFTRIDDDTLEVRIAAGSDERLQRGMSIPLSETYCRHTVKKEKPGPLIIEHASEEGWTGDPAFERFDLNCYVGTTVLVDGEPYGTVCFTDRTPAEETFTEPQRTFVELLTEWAGYELEQRIYERQYRRLTERITDAYYAFDGDWRVTYWNDTAAERGDTPAEEIVGENFWEQFPELEGTDYEETIRAAKNEQELRSCEFYYKPRGYWFEVRAYPDEEGITVISEEITDRKEHEQELAYRRALLEAQAETTIDGLLIVDSDRTVRYHNDRFLDIWNLPADAAVERSDESLLELVDELIAHPDEFRERVEYLYENPEETSRDTIELTDGRWLDRYSAPVIDDGTYYGRLWVFRDVTERKERERKLARQRDELAQLQRLNTLVRETVQALQDTATRDAIETAVCERLTGSDLYQVAWIGTRQAPSTRDPTILTRTAAGVDEADLDGGPDDELGPARTALRTGEVQVVDDVATENLRGVERETALDGDRHALAAVPLTTGETTYGVLVVYSPREHTIGDPEQEVLADLGRSIALAIQRVYSQRSLTAETAVSLELRVPDADIGFAEVSTALGCTLALERRVPISDGRTIYYFTVHGADPMRVCDKLEGGQLVDESSVVREGKTDEPALIETCLEGTHKVPIDVLTDYGASMKSARAADGDISLCAEFPPGVDVRTVLTDLREIVPAIEVRSKRHVDRPTRTVTALQDQVKDQLTPKQEAALRTAHARGYYAWPRDSTVEEIADTFDVSAPTVHYRLRKAHQTVVETLLDDEHPGTSG